MEIDGQNLRIGLNKDLGFSTKVALKTCDER